MPTIEAALVAAITGDAGMAALIATRVFPAGARQGSDYPYLTYQRISSPQAEHLEGDSDLQWPLFQFDSWDKTGLGALTVAEALRTFLCPRPVVERTGAGLTFTTSFQDQRGPTRDEETKNFGCSQDFSIWHERT